MSDRGVIQYEFPPWISMVLKWAKKKEVFFLKERCVYWLQWRKKIKHKIRDELKNFKASKQKNLYYFFQCSFIIYFNNYDTDNKTLVKKK